MTKLKAALGLATLALAVTALPVTAQEDALFLAPLDTTRYSS